MLTRPPPVQPKVLTLSTFFILTAPLTIWLIMPLDHKDMPQVGYYHLEIIQKYLKFFKNYVYLRGAIEIKKVRKVKTFG